MKPKIKHKSIKSLKKTCWKWFSLYRRLLYADKNGMVRCVTCGVRKHYKEIQASHFVDGRGNAVLFNEDLVYPACYRCNVCLHGNKVKYTLFMLTKHSPEEIKYFESLRYKVRKFTVAELEEKIKVYKAEVKRLKKC